jgi:ribosomal protein L11 methyltransferase
MPFWRIAVPALPDIADGLTNFLWEQGALGVVEEDVPPEPEREVAFFPEAISTAALLGAVRAYCASLRSLGFPLGGVEPEITPLLDEAWASAWQQSFPPRSIGDRLLVLPPWEAAHTNAEDPTRVTIVIEPGRAFGTGHHGSTEGCLVLLERALGRAPGARVLDIGTGSGILAVAAVKLGAGRVLAVDVDPDATAAAKANVDRNACADRVEIALTGPESVQESYPVVVANLLTHTHLALASLYGHLVAPAGALVLGGILADEDASVAAAVAPVGFALAERRVLDGWSALLLHRDAGERA